MARVRTLAEMRAEVRQRADMVNSQFVSNAEIDRYLNESISELYDLIIETAGQEYFLDSFLISTIANQDTYALPNDFYQLKGVDAQLGGPAPYCIRPYVFNERNEANQFPGFWGNYYLDIRYRLLGAANVQATQELNTFLGTISSFATTTIANDTIVLPTVNMSETFRTGARLGFRAPGSLIPIAAGLQADIVQAQYTGRVVTGANLVAAGVAVGWEIYLVRPGEYVPRIRFTPMPTGANQLTVWYIPHAPVLVADTDVWNGFNGWEEYPIVDAAIKCLEKEESDTGALELRKQRLMNRIQSLSQKRDGAFPERVTDVYQPYYLGGRW